MTPAERTTVSIEEHWRRLVTVAMLGTDRRDPPDPAAPIADLVADTVRRTPSERMLAQVAATVAVRRAGLLPGPAREPMAGPDPDERPVCVPAAVQRWHHVVSSWPVLEDEWLSLVVVNGWRAAPEMVPALLQRHRGDPVRRAVAEAACGPLADWLVEHLPALAAVRATPAADRSTGALAALPALPISSDLTPLLSQTGAARVLATGIETGGLGPSHRGVLVNLIARVRIDALAEIATSLDSIDPQTPGHGLATVLADLARTRAAMADELGRPVTAAG
jgi:hypothetical protein